MKYNLHSFSLFIFSLLAFSSKICRGADYQYEACLPTNCGGSGPNISFPFFLTSQQSYCGYPGFSIKCRNGFPLLQLSENEYVIDDIFYHNRSLHVFNAAALSLSSSSSSNCSQGLIRIRNTTLPAGRFNYVGGENLLLFSRCRNATGDLLRYEVGCNSSSREGVALAMYGGNGNVGRALRTCEESVVARAELSGDDEVVDVAAVFEEGICDELDGE
ncbi:uncharacterized protein LOC125210034 [Salvia hispanica]|uniref:uncharacterized protein LOC125210034 n=1 Tax=Salvia hispanica TaxID=49212 RepID=UPI002008FBCF|nr:uncharacterized protein LOC125210034 [Salvia hispanica]